jgi:hypothetical protein
MIGAFILVGLADGASRGGDVAGTLLRAGVTAAVWISPLIALGSAGWVMLVRRFTPPIQLPLGEPSATGRSARDASSADPYGPDSASS